MKDYKGIIIYGVLGVLLGYLTSAVAFHLSMYITLLLIGFSGSVALTTIVYVVLVLLIASICLFFINKLTKLLTEDETLVNVLRITATVMFLALVIYSRVWNIDLSVFS